MPKFSIVIPVRDRQKELMRALSSLDVQTFQDFEVIVVDDCSKEPVSLWKYSHDSRFHVVRLEEHSNRVIARNAGLALMDGEWYCALDSDDAYAAHYLQTIADAEKEFPEARCFNFGAVVHWKTATTLRQTFRPNWLGNKHEEFKSGKIGQGSFVVRTDALDEIAMLPSARNPYKFHEMATDAHHLYPFPGQTFGNPWGDDWLMFYRVTRVTRSIPLDGCLYTQYVRGHIK